MKIIVLLAMLLVCITAVSGFRVETMSYSVDRTNTGLAGSQFDSASYTGRFYFEPFYPASNAETNFYWLHPGYFEMTFGVSHAVNIDLISPLDNVFFSGNNSFSYNVTTNGSIASCDILVYQGGVALSINETDSAPINYSFGPYSLPESNYTWKIECMNYLGNVSTSALNTFTVDNTKPMATIVSPLTNSTPYNNFTFDVLELNPSFVVIGINGTDYVYNYTNGTNVFSPSLPLGYYSYNVTFFDKANNSNSYGPFNMYVNANPVQITNVRFDTIVPLANFDEKLLATITGGFSNVTVSVFTNNTGWINHSVITFSGPAPYTYYYDVDGGYLIAGETLMQQWYVLDNTNTWRKSAIYNATIKKRSTGGGGTFPEGTTISGGIGNLTIVPDPIQIRNLKGAIFEVKNYNNIDCELMNVRVQNILGNDNLQDRFDVKTLDTVNLTIGPNSSVSLLMKPTGIKGIVGNGMIYAESKNCGTATANLGVEIYFSDILIDNINEFTGNVVSWFEEIIG